MSNVLIVVILVAGVLLALLLRRPRAVPVAFANEREERLADGSPEGRGVEHGCRAPAEAGRAEARRQGSREARGQVDREAGRQGDEPRPSGRRRLSASGSTRGSKRT